MKKLVYLAVPYSDPDPKVRQARFEASNRAAAMLMRAGDFVFSPISHTHPIALAGDLPLGWDYWEQYDRAVLACCYRFIILKLDGWNHSKGIKGEVRIAEEFGIEVETMDPV